jgi:glutathione S-transferase
MNMKTLYHHPICPLSRQVRLYLQELGLNFELVKEEYWRRRSDFININPAGLVPVFKESSGLYIVGIYPITEYLYEQYPNFNFMDEDKKIKCEIRRLVSWFNEKFHNEVTKILIEEKVIRSLSHLGEPRTERLRVVQANFSQHMQYLSHLLTKQSFLVSESISCADFAAACHLSILDYFGEIHWDNWNIVRHWYSIIKSRPSFRSLLRDQVAGFVPAQWYADLDF